MWVAEKDARTAATLVVAKVASTAVTTVFWWVEMRAY